MKFICAIVLSLCSLALTPFGPFWGSGQVATITVPSNWGEVDCGQIIGTCNTTSAAKTITVPAGSSGAIKFVIGSETANYKKNAGSFTALSNNQVISFANGDTLTVQITGLTCDDCGQIFTLDNVTGAYIGGVTGFTGCNIAPCPDGP